MIVLYALETENLDTVCYRGSAPLHELATISGADVYDQETNPKGLQRDLSPKHATEAYDYVTRDPDPKLPRAFPEVLLNVRDKSVVDVQDVESPDGFPGLVKLTFDLDAIAKSKAVKVSRVDGNHRLFYGAGDGENREPVEALVPFQVHIGRTKDQEATLFADINSNHKGMNTSHLAVLRSRLTPDEVEVIARPWRTFAMRLTEDEASPFKGQVHMGGAKKGSKAKGVKHVLTFVALENAVKRLLSRSQHLQELDSSDAKYALVRSYWQAVQMTWPEAFETPADYLLAKGFGVNVMAQVGGVVIDRCMVSNSLDARDMAAELAHMVDAFDWHKDAPHDTGVGGMSGNKAILLVAGKMLDRLPKVSKT